MPGIPGGLLLCALSLSHSLTSAAAVEANLAPEGAAPAVVACLSNVRDANLPSMLSTIMSCVCVRMDQGDGVPEGEGSTHLKARQLPSPAAAAAGRGKKWGRA